MAKKSPPAAGRGRPPGAPNKTTVAVKEAMEHVYIALQNKAPGRKAHGHFTEWAEGNPTEFYKLYAKLLPKEITGPGAEGQHLIEVWCNGMPVLRNGKPVG